VSRPARFAKPFDADDYRWPNPRPLARPLIACGLSWIAVAEVCHGDLFLAVNTLLAAVYVLIEPWLRAADATVPPEAPAVTPAPTVRFPIAGASGAVPATTPEAL
jgi:hypothetical protein